MSNRRRVFSRLGPLRRLAPLILALGCTPAGPSAERPGMPVAAPVVPAREPDVRVGLAIAEDSVTAGGTAFEIRDSTGVLVPAARGDWRFTADAEGHIRGVGPGASVGPRTGPLQLQPRGGLPLRVDGQGYRGEVLVVSNAPARVTAVNVLALEDYLRGVVPREMPSIALEALKAQAVAARTYAIASLESQSSRGFDVYGSTKDQAYGGAGAEDSMASEAVRQTRGQIVTYGGAPIMAYYHSTCGGRTAAVDQVWSKPPAPYLQSVSDARPGGGYYCDISKHFHWREEWSGTALARVLRRTLADVRGGAPGDVAVIRDVAVEGRTPSGRAATLKVETDRGTFRVRGDSIRWVLQPASGGILESTLFRLEETRSGGQVQRLVAVGRGWGHGVGMCQMGAIGRAEAGQGYRKILRTYYPGTDITTLY